MTISNHLTVIARQLWASLTGGWYYEPSNSIFCNTVHLYLWSILFLTPLLLSIVSLNKNFTNSLFCAYTIFIIILFSMIKLTVAYLHNLFDNAEPVITQKVKKNFVLKDTNNFSQNSTSSIKNVPTIENNIIEMIDLNNQLSRGSNQKFEKPITVDNSYKKLNTTTINNINVYNEKVNKQENSNNLVEIEKKKNLSYFDSNTSSNNESQSSLNELNICNNYKRKINRAYSKSSKIFKLADSLEMLPIINNSQSRRNPLNKKKLHSQKTNFGLKTEILLQKRSQNQQKLHECCFALRKVQSLSENLNTDKEKDQLCLQIKNNFNSQINLLNKFDNFDNRTRDQYLIVNNDLENNLFKQDDLYEQPCCSKNILQNTKIDLNLVKENLTINDEFETISIPNQKILNRPVSFLHKKINYLNEKDSTQMANDLKGEITQFLEELIQKHPETLDAIENVRMNRMGKNVSDVNRNFMYHHDFAQNKILNHSLNDLKLSSIDDNYCLNVSDSTHVAYDHEDTSQGAIHSFQDEQGNWWTYAFDEKSSGTAQALGSSRAIFKMFNNRQKQQINDTKLDANNSQKYYTTPQILISANTNFNKKSKDIYNRLNKSNISNNNKLVLVNESNIVYSKNKILENKFKKELKDGEFNEGCKTSLKNLNYNLYKKKNVKTTVNYNKEIDLQREVLKKKHKKRNRCFSTSHAILLECKKRQKKALIRDWHYRQLNSRRYSHPEEQCCTNRLHHNHFLYCSQKLKNLYYNNSSASSLASSSSSINTKPRNNILQSYSSTSLSDASDEIESNKYLSQKPTNIFFPVEAKSYSFQKQQSNSKPYTNFSKISYQLSNPQSVSEQENSKFSKICINDLSTSFSNKDLNNLFSSSKTIPFTSVTRPKHKKLNQSSTFNQNIKSGLKTTVINNEKDLNKSFTANVDICLNNQLKKLATVTSACSTNYNLSTTEKFEYNDLSESVNCRTVVNNNLTNSYRNDVVQNINQNSRQPIRSLSSMQFTNDFHSIGQSTLQNDSNVKLSNYSKMSYYYKLQLIPKQFFMKTSFKIKINRLLLCALFDQNYFFWHCIFDIGLASLVSFLASMLISLNVYSDLSLPLFSFVIAGSQFSLLKSVQPDSASPIHGFNRIIVYSRPIYFCILLSMFFIIDVIAKNFGQNIAEITKNKTDQLYFKFAIINNNEILFNNLNHLNDIGWFWTPTWINLYTQNSIFFSLKNFILTTILFLPFIFTIGLLPQINTFIQHFVEQIDIYFFGGTASFSLLSSILSFLRSLLTVSFLSCIGYISYKLDLPSAQNFVFSAFVSLTISTAFLASRWSSNPLMLHIFLKNIKNLLFCQKKKQKKIRRRQKLINYKKNSTQTSSSTLSCFSTAVSTSDLNTPFLKSFCCKNKSIKKTENFTNKNLFKPASNYSSKYKSISLALLYNTNEKSNLKLKQTSKVFCSASLPNLTNNINITKEFLNKRRNSYGGYETVLLEKKNKIYINKKIKLKDDLLKNCKKLQKNFQHLSKKFKNRKKLIKKKNVTKKKCYLNNIDIISKTIKKCVITRFQSDIFFFAISTILLFGLHSTSIFLYGQPYLELVLCILSIIFGFFNNVVYPQLRSHTPWQLFAQPLLKPHEFNQFETTVEAKLMRFEKIHVWMCAIEKNILYPFLVTSFMSVQPWKTSLWSMIFTALSGFRIARSGFAQPQLIVIPLTFTFFLTYREFIKNFLLKFEFANKNSLYTTFFLPSLSLLYIFMAVWPKIEELILKINFIFIYIAPWQISWGSAFHAFAQPFSVPHTGLIFAQAIISSLISAPLNPFLGSSFFLISYVRPVKFWEKNYNTKRVDHSTLRLISQLDRTPMIDDSNLNSIFYEHLTRSLQNSLAGDLLLGRWGTSVQQGDCFILASLYLNCLVQIIEIGNGFVTFQVRGLEFRGTYCHQREVEAISEDWNDNGECCCCKLGKLSNILCFNSVWSLRWQAWEVVAAKYIIDGYSITDNSAVNLLQVHEFRRLLITLYVKCIIFYASRSAKLEKWLLNKTILKALETIQNNARYVDSDQMFSAVTDEDYDINYMGITKACFIDNYGEWMNHCINQRRMNVNNKFNNLIENKKIDPNLILCFFFANSILGRRVLSTASFNRHANSAESLLYGLHALFKGDIRITSSADEWVFSDPEILAYVISPAVRMALKLHQDHFAAIDDYENVESFYNRVFEYQTKIFISHEHDPTWREAILTNTPSLLALRHVFDDGQDDYKIIMLNKLHLNMRVIKLNRECVRAFWAGQQQELIFFRNRNPERGSIQNARQVLRNMINSSADQPIGYPIFVSPLVTSFVEMHSQIEKKLFGIPITFCTIWKQICNFFSLFYKSFDTSSTSNLQQQTLPSFINVENQKLNNRKSTNFFFKRKKYINTKLKLNTTTNN